MDTLALLHSRRSVKVADLVEPGPTEAQLDAILRAAIRVPDHGKLAPWRIHVMHAEGQAALGDFLADLFAKEIPEANAKQIAFERQRPQRAPLLLVVVSTPVVPHKIPEFEQLMSGGAVCTHILLAAHAQGLAGQWLTEWPAYRPEVVAHLGHDPAKDRILGFFYLGTPREKPDERPRPALDEVVGEWRGAVAEPAS
jgi:nitroreductase